MFFFKMYLIFIVLLVQSLFRCKILQIDWRDVIGILILCAANKFVNNIFHAYT